jgi:hypothetical protein
MAAAAPDPGSGPVTPLPVVGPVKHRAKRVPEIIPIPSRTGTFQGAVFIQALPVPPSPIPSSAGPASSVGPDASSAAGSANGNISSMPGSSASPTGTINSDSHFPMTGPTSSNVGPISSPASAGLSPMSTAASSGMGAISSPASASLAPVPRSTGGVSSWGPGPLPSLSGGLGGVGVSIDVNINQTIYVGSSDFGAAGYGWWLCSESDVSGEPNPGSSLGWIVEEYGPGSCVVNVAVMEYVSLEIPRQRRHSV